jgi:heme-degrading monooxygenase HmoA
MKGTTMFVAIAIHHVTPEHTDEMLAFMHRVIDRTTGSAGLIDFKACREVDRGALAGYSRWESQADFEAGLAAITSLRHERNPEWTVEPDEVITLEVL